MKVALLGSAAKVHVRRWAAWLAGRGHQVVVFSDSPAPAGDLGGARLERPRWPWAAKLVEFKIRGGPHANERGKARAYAAAIRRFAPDVLHAHEALGYGPMLGRFPRYPRVLTPWGPDIESLAAGRGDERDQLVQAACRAADLIAANAPGLEDRWAQLTGVARDRFRMFSWGVDLTVFQRASEERQAGVRARLGLPPDTRLLLSPRLARPYWGVDRIVRAWGLAGAARDAMLVVLRAGAPEPDWRRLQSDSPDDPTIRWIDERLSENDLAALYSTCRGVVMAPETDLLAMSLLEAMACGSVPVAADQPAYRAAVAPVEAAREGLGLAYCASDGSPEALATAIREWLGASEDNLAELGALNASAAAEHHDRERCALRMEAVYREAVEIHASRGAGGLR